MRKQEQQEIKQSVILVGIGFQINKIRKIQYPVKEILEEEIIRLAAEPRLNNKSLVSATDKPHDIAGTIRVIYALEYHLITCNILGIINIFREHKHALAFKLIQRFVSYFSCQSGNIRKGSFFQL